MGRAIRLVSLILLTVVFIAGCGKESSVSDSTPDSESVDYEVAYKEAPVNDVLAGNWIKGENGSADSFMTLSDYKAGVFGISNPGKQFIWGYFSDSKFLYSLEGFYSEDTDNTHSVYLSKLNVETNATEVIDYGEASDLWLQNPYSIGGRVFANAVSYEEGEGDEETLVFQNVELLSDGTIKEMADYVPILEKEGMMPEVGVSPESKLIYEPASGRTYIIPLESDCIVIANERGDYVSTFRGFMGGGAQTLSDFVHTEDGHVIFICAEGNKETVFVFENYEPRILYEGSRGLEADSSCGVIDSHGNILFAQGMGFGTVISWDIATGALQKLYSSGEDNARANTIDCLARNEKGELLLIINDNLKVLSLSGPAATVEITVAQLDSVTYVPNQCIKRYEDTHPGVSFDTTAGVSGENREIKLNQLYTDIVKGTGPDLIFLSYDDLAPFVENKCLYDLSDMLKPEIRDNLVPAVAASGSIDGGKYLMGIEPNLHYLFINKKYCTADSWSVSDILKIAEKREKEGNPFDWLVVGQGYRDNPLWVMLSNVGTSEFVDLKNHTCDFESDTFIKLLDLCKKDTDKGDKGRGDAIKLMKEDRALIYLDYMTMLSGYSETYKSLGEDEFRTIGYPTTSGNGYKMWLHYGFAVNSYAMADPDKKRVIEDFLNCMNTFEYQIDSVGVAVPTRMDLYDGRIILPSEWDYINTPMLSLGDGSYLTLAGKQDGTSFVDDYLELLRNCESEDESDVYSEVIMEIIEEESAPFFDGKKSAEEVAKVIQNRVMIYLMENE